MGVEIRGDKREAAYQMRLIIIDHISKHIKESGLSEQSVAEIVGLSQPRISNLLNRHYRKFTIDSLVTIANNVGLNVNLYVDAGD